MKRHSSNHDETKTNNQMCACGHKKSQHEVHPDTLLYFWLQLSNI